MVELLRMVKLKKWLAKFEKFKTLNLLIFVYQAQNVNMR